MTDYDPSPVPSPPLHGLRAWTHVMYGLHVLSAVSGILTSATIVGAFVFGWPSIIAIIINLIKRSEARHTWLDSHFQWQLRTFGFSVLWLIVAGGLAITFIGIPLAILVLLVAGLWVLYRMVRGWMALMDGRPLPI